MLAQRLDTSFRTADDVRQALRIPVLGAIGLLSGRRQPALVTLQQPPIAAGEDFRVLRNSLLFAAAGNARTLAVTSALAQEGKTRTAANLAIVLAQAGHDCVLVDADLRRPTLHRLFRVPDRPGLSDMVVAGEFQPDLLRPTAEPRLWLLTSGAPIDNPSELLGSPAFRRVIDRLATDIGFVVLDTAPVNGIADAGVVAGQASMTLLVIDAGRTPRAAVDDALLTLERAGASLTGAVLNRLTARSQSYYYASTRRAPIPLRVHKERAA
jgi:non-specific protein-tyrosine kinase